MLKASRSSKKRRTESDEDVEAAEHDTSTGLTPSVRQRAPDSLPALTTIAARIFASNYRRLRTGVKNKTATDMLLQNLPDHLVSKVFAMLTITCPELLSSTFITLYFTRGPTVILTDQLPGVKERNISKLGDGAISSGLRHLELCGFDYADSLFASSLKDMNSLRVLNLR
ncbi:hypothetical protein HWV62_19847 [Athelia sp. TMB]|nr:hypothetical protein HWV62_19847 [Athelia sp. TMB]